MAPTTGVSRSLTSAVTTEPNAAPTTTATARSTTFPRMTKSLNWAPSPLRASAIEQPPGLVLAVWSTRHAASTGYVLGTCGGSGAVGAGRDAGLEQAGVLGRDLARGVPVPVLHVDPGPGVAVGGRPGRVPPHDRHVVGEREVLGHEATAHGPAGHGRAQPDLEEALLERLRGEARAGLLDAVGELEELVEVV